MSDFADAPLIRDQLVLFSTKLDEIVPQNHCVRMLDDILERIDWTKWEHLYDRRRGQPPIHPRVLAGAILYGILTRIRSSRSLEEALIVRNDFRWLVSGRTIDHTTLSKFRQKNAQALKDLFVQVGLVAQSLGYMPLSVLGFDGTRIRANNRRSGSRTPEELRKAQKELAEKFQELEAKTAALDASEEEQLGQLKNHELAKQLANVANRRKLVDAALAEVERLKEAGQGVPNRIPITDPESRITPNKDGGFAPNFTPIATVDIDSGLIVSATVIPHTDEDKHMFSALEDVKESFSLSEPPKELLADGMMATGDNLAQCQAAGIDFYSPIRLGVSTDNPANREDPTQAVASKDIDRLPTITTKTKSGAQVTRFRKEAFVYDAENNCYWCPAGKALPFAKQTSEPSGDKRIVRYRYMSSRSDCAQCPLASRCITSSTPQRQVEHTQHEELRVAHAKKMAEEESKRKYARRRHAGERPFAMIKQHFGVRQFLTRGLAKVRSEWLWLTTAFNLHRLMRLMAKGTGPPIKELAS